MTIKSLIRNIPDYPKKGIIFRDITTLIKDPAGFKFVINNLKDRYSEKIDDFDTIAGIESRGFIVGGALSYCLGKGFIPIRKKGKLPAETVSHEYELEYGTDTVEIHKDAISNGDRVLIVDDLLATGGTAMAAVSLIEKLGGIVAELAFVVDLPDLMGSKKITDRGYDIYTMIEFEGE
ncbi:adenine phosphoribosyltransferase [Thermodesulfobacteriota bacterium]